MFQILKRSLEIGIATGSYPDSVAEPPDGFRGKPVIDFARCTACGKCAEACPTAAITVNPALEQQETTAREKTLSVSYGDCIFCGECEASCPDRITLSKEFQLAARRKEDLTSRALYTSNGGGIFSFVGMLETATDGAEVEQSGKALREKIHSVFGRSLHIREVDAGSCNGCEVEITAVNNAIYDAERFGIHFVASPRHADMLLVTGPVTRNMEIALRQTYEATPSPKLVVAVGACAIGGGVFGKSYSSCGGVDGVIPVDVYVPGCPPRPEAILHGILLAISERAWHRNTIPELPEGSPLSK